MACQIGISSVGIMYADDELILGLDSWSALATGSFQVIIETLRRRSDASSGVTNSHERL